MDDLSHSDKWQEQGIALCPKQINHAVVMVPIPYPVECQSRLVCLISSGGLSSLNTVFA